MAVWQKCIFLCVKPLEFKSILEEIKPYMSEDKHLISISGTVTLKCIEDTLNCKISKIMPTVISEIKEGITLICHNDRVLPADTEFIEGLLSNISRIKHVDEKDFGFASELTSCAPGLISPIFGEFVKSALRHTESFSDKDIEGMILHTLFRYSETNAG